MVGCDDLFCLIFYFVIVVVVVVVGGVDRGEDMHPGEERHAAVEDRGRPPRRPRRRPACCAHHREQDPSGPQMSRLVDLWFCLWLVFVDLGFAGGFRPCPHSFFRISGGFVGGFELWYCSVDLGFLGRVVWLITSGFDHDRMRRLGAS